MERGIRWTEPPMGQRNFADATTMADREAVARTVSFLLSSNGAIEREGGQQFRFLVVADPIVPLQPTSTGGEFGGVEPIHDVVRAVAEEYALNYDNGVIDLRGSGPEWPEAAPVRETVTNNTPHPELLRDMYRDDHNDARPLGLYLRDGHGGDNIEQISNDEGVGILMGHLSSAERRAVSDSLNMSVDPPPWVVATWDPGGYMVRYFGTEQEAMAIYAPAADVIQPIASARPVSDLQARIDLDVDEIDEALGRVMRDRVDASAAWACRAPRERRRRCRLRPPLRGRSEGPERGHRRRSGHR